jgi:tripartite ATP-independent transporter DctP family solute receptor
MQTGWRLSLLLVPTLTVGFSAGCERKGEQDEVTVLKLAHGLDVTHPVHKGMVFMAERVKQKSGGKLRVDIYPNEQLGTERECIEQIQLGALAMTKTSTGPMEGFVPQMKVFGLPYLFRDEEHMWKVFEGPIGKELLAAGVPKGLKGLCYYDAGARSFYTRDKEIESPEDLAGMKIRVMQSEMCMKMVSAMGGSPTPIAWGELYTSLQQGVVDGAENNPPSFHTSKHYEICKYYILDEHLRLPDMLLISPKVWEGLSPEHRNILQQAVDESVVEQRKLWAASVAEALEVVGQAGVAIVRPDKRPFREAVGAIWAEIAGTEIGELAQRIQAVE